MGKNTEFNRTAGPIYYAAMQAARELAVLLPDAPPIPALPYFPLSARALVWCDAVLDRADAAALPEAEAWRATLRGAIEGWRALLRDHGKMAPAMGAEIKQFVQAVPMEKGAGMADAIAAAIEAGTLTPCQAGHWRVRLGLPDPETARARQAG